MNVLDFINDEINELRWAAFYYWKKGNRTEARKCYWEIQGLRRAQGIVERTANRLERAA